MGELIKINISGIKCDMPNCGWHDDTARFEDYDQWLNRPCPACRGNLLTQRDLDLTRKILARVGWFNRWFGWLTIFTKGGWRQGGRIHMDGTGVARVERLPPVKVREDA